MPPIRSVLHFNTLANGGAAYAARKIHDSLVVSGVDSRYCYVDGSVNNPTYQKLRFRARAGVLGKVWHGIVRRFRQRIGAPRPGFLEPFGWSTIPGLTIDLDLSDCRSIVHLHWIVGLLDYGEFFRNLPIATPVVWTLHDMNPLTGGCHYAWECNGFIGRCTQCPQLARIGRRSMARTSQMLRRRTLADRNLHIVADSHWLEAEAKKSWILESALSFRTIHYGVDLEAFQPRKPLATRRRLGIDDAATVIAFGTDRLDNKRKGFLELCAALARLSEKENLELLTFGELGNALGPEGVKWQHLGVISSTEELSTLYSAADIYVMASLQEAFGQTAQEALACATPVVAFDVGGISDMVRPNQTGLLARVSDVDHLAQHISDLVLHPTTSKRLGQNGRDLMERQFSLSKQRDSYLNLYTEISNNHAPQSA